MTETGQWYDGLAIPYLMRLARGSYGERSRSLLAEAGFDDLPRNAGWILTGLVEARRPLSDITGELFMGSSAASTMVDTLLVRGYVERELDLLGLTERGRAATEVIQSAVDQVDEELEARLSSDQLAGLRAGLAALHDIREAR